MPVVRRISVADLATLKAVRLRALADSPGAFGSTLQREEAMPDDEWIARFERSAWFLAFDENDQNGEALGLVCAFNDPAHPTGRHLVSMWVEPALRGTSIAEQLVDAVIALAREEGADHVLLWVAEDNGRARRFYERIGFVGTGERQPLPSNPSVGEERMTLPL
jgi:ribosomal protein S18 acetylase RimI-like enzyme